MKSLPSRAQWKKWSLVSRLTAVGAYVGVIGVLLTLLLFGASYYLDSNRPQPPGRLVNSKEELISLLETRADMARSGLEKIDNELHTAYLTKFDDLHSRHIVALKDGNLIVAHEIDRDIKQLSNEVTEAWKKHREETGSSGPPMPGILYAPPPDKQLSYYTSDTEEGMRRLNLNR